MQNGCGVQQGMVSRDRYDYELDPISIPYEMEGL
jgi:hypothetical protein